MEYDLHHNIGTRLALAIAVIATDTTTAGAIIDSQGFESLEFVIQTGVVTAGDVTMLIEGSDADDMAGAVAITGDDLLGEAQVMAAADFTQRLGVIAKYRYYRLSAVTDNSANLTVGASVILGNPQSAPVAESVVA